VNTLKSAALVVVCAGICYAVYVYLTAPQGTGEAGPQLAPPEVEWDELVPAAQSPPPADVKEEESERGSLYGRDQVAAEPPGGTIDENPADPPNRTASAASSNSKYADAVVRAGGVSPPALASPRTPAEPFDLDAAKRRVAIHTFRRDWVLAQQQVDEGNFRQALVTLSPYHDLEGLPAEEQAQLSAWLDALAAKVIYSREHLLTSKYKVRGSRVRMIDVAMQYNVTAQLLQKINAEVVNNPDVLLPGTELKVVPGPFRAEVDLARSEITVFLGELYAGRFPFARGDEPVAPGQYQVQGIKALPAYFGSDGRTIPGNDPANPYGTCAIELGSQIRIHGSPLTGPGGSTRGCISLSPRDIEDLAAILTTRSIVVIR
jgi:lipoprotein-anchoring transpeptidase ErfK/SrfK